jgi:hypothetical protein
MYRTVEGDRCHCTWGYLIAKDGFLVCSDCGGAITPSGKYLPRDSGWTIPQLNDDDRAQSDERVQARIRASLG